MDLVDCWRCKEGISGFLGCAGVIEIKEGVWGFRILTGFLYCGYMG